jgi:pantoate--beta-alanine ligase
METITRIQPMRERVASWRRKNQRVALVPTMGNLHKGHVSLVARAQELADKVVVSAFVNPLQFGPTEDFDNYPRTFEHDTQALTRVHADAMFHPGAFEMYPMGHERSTIVDVPELSGILCGAFRPGHFAGMATVVTKLLNIVKPDVSVFGEKDYQQLMIIRRVASDLGLPGQIESLATIRDHDGLALSSRNRFLNRGERNTAPKMYLALKAAVKQIQDGETDYDAIQQHGMRALEIAGFEPQYFAIRQANDLQPVRENSRELVILAAAKLGKTRLIDNIKAMRPDKPRAS